MILQNNQVQQITDLSGNNYHAIFSGGIPQNYNSPSVLGDRLNGQPVLRFPGNCYFTHTYLGEIGTAIALVRPSWGRMEALLGAKGESRQLPYAAFYWSTCQPNGHCTFERTDYNGNPIQVTTPMKVDEWNVWTGRVESNAISFFLNSYCVGKAEILSFAAMVSDGVLGASWYNNSIGNYWAGEFAELAIYSQPLTGAQIGSIVTYLKRNTLYRWSMNSKEYKAAVTVFTETINGFVFNWQAKFNPDPDELKAMADVFESIATTLREKAELKQDEQRTN